MRNIASRIEGNENSQTLGCKYAPQRDGHASFGITKNLDCAYTQETTQQPIPRHSMAPTRIEKDIQLRARPTPKSLLFRTSCFALYLNCRPECPGNSFTSHLLHISAFRHGNQTLRIILSDIRYPSPGILLLYPLQILLLPSWTVSYLICNPPFP